MVQRLIFDFSYCFRPKTALMRWRSRRSTFRSVRRGVTRNSQRSIPARRGCPSIDTRRGPEHRTAHSTRAPRHLQRSPRDLVSLVLGDGRVFCVVRGRDDLFRGKRVPDRRELIAERPAHSAQPSFLEPQVAAASSFGFLDFRFFRLADDVVHELRISRDGVGLAWQLRRSRTRTTGTCGSPESRPGLRTRCSAFACSGASVSPVFPLHA
mmetsp:Transcript_13358/g.32707  ORF Transcript_13358/g.32707 Transcript_13358/m.32707 type:complete len:210 (+) Transcript_13358:1098-1727(+)